MKNESIELGFSPTIWILSISKLFSVFKHSFARRAKRPGADEKNVLKTIENADSDDLFTHLLMCDMVPRMYSDSPRVTGETTTSTFFVVPLLLCLELLKCSENRRGVVGACNANDTMLRRSVQLILVAENDLFEGSMLIVFWTTLDTKAEAQQKMQRLSFHLSLIPEDPVSE